MARRAGGDARRRRVEGVLFDRLRLGAPDARGRHSLEPTGERFMLLADTVVSAIGQALAAGAARMGAVPSAVRSRSIGPGRTSARMSIAGGDAVNGGASVVQAVAEAGARRARSRRTCARA